MSDSYDLLIIGGGPAGSAAAYWAAKRGVRTLVLEKREFPRDKTCGDGLTPRAIKELTDMGLSESLSSFHKHKGLRVRAHKRTLEIRWPSHPVYPDYGYVVRRKDLDKLLADHARAAGAEFMFNTEAIRPICVTGSNAGPTQKIETVEVKDKNSGELDASHLDRHPDRHVAGQVASHTTGHTTSHAIKARYVDAIKARYVIVADGANSRFGRALGTSRNRSLPQGMAIRTYFESPAHDDPWIESALDIVDRKGRNLPGYGWVFPLGDGTVNAGIGVISSKDYKNANTSWLMEEWAHSLSGSAWQIDCSKPLIAPVGGRLPMGGSVSPRAGDNWMVVGDAAGTINPFNGEGIDYAYETGRAAANFVAAALERTTNATAEYERWLENTYGLYFKVGRIFARAIGNPDLISRLTSVGMQSQTLMEWAFRIMANLLRPSELKPAELAYGMMKSIAQRVPETAAA